MGNVASNVISERSAGETSVNRLLNATGYPDRVPGGTMSFTLRVDGMEVFAEEMDGRLVLSHALSGDERLLPTLAAYAAGRMLREDATLAYGNCQTIKPLGPQAFIWQEAPADADAHRLRRLLETFMNSCDWWRARVDALRESEAESASVPETMMIRP